MVEFTRQVFGHDVLVDRGATMKAQATLLKVGDELFF